MAELRHAPPLLDSALDSPRRARRDDSPAQTLAAIHPTLHLVDSFNVGGAERQFCNLVAGLRETEFRPHVACFRHEGPLLAEVIGQGAPLQHYPLRSLRSPGALVKLLSLTRYLVRNRIDVVHTMSLYPNVFGVLAAWLARTPAIVASVRDMGHMWSPDLLRLQRATCRLADVVVTNAEAIAERLRREGYAPAKIEVIRNGIRPSPHLPRSHAEFRRELGIPANAPIVGAVCRIHWVKRLEDFLDAAALVTRRAPEARFLVVGPFAPSTEGKAYAETLHARAESLGLGDRVIFTGPRGDVARMLTEFSVSVLPSQTEGLSNTLLESMAAGVPVVATAVDGSVEIVEHGVTGWLVPMGDSKALADAIADLLASPERAAELGLAGRRRVEREFGCERMVERTTDLYARLLARARRGRRSATRPGGGAR